MKTKVATPGDILAAVGIGCVSANFVAALFGLKTFAGACEWSFAQTLALLIAWRVLRR